MFQRLLVLCALGALLPLAAHAAGTAGAVGTRYGVRGGFSSSPDQLVLGGQMTIGEVAPNLSFDPNIEMGFGDNTTLIGFNLDMHYHFDLRNTSWRPYVGGGAGINYIQTDVPPGVGGDNSVTKVAGSFIFGAGVPTHSGNQFFAELKFGLGTYAPDFKMLVGWNF
jgi:opacity protein-like surface antigen